MCGPSAWWRWCWPSWRPCIRAGGRRGCARPRRCAMNDPEMTTMSSVMSEQKTEQKTEQATARQAEQQSAGQPPAGQPVLACQGLGKTYTQGKYSVDVLSGISFEVHRGERVAIVGAS